MRFTLKIIAQRKQAKSVIFIFKDDVKSSFSLFNWNYQTDSSVDGIIVLGFGDKRVKKSLFNVFCTEFII